MRIAVCSGDTDERHHISKLTDELMLQHGLLPKISLFPMALELLESSARQVDPFDIIILSDHRDESILQRLCKLTSVILVGQRHIGPTAFEAGAAYFVESPVESEKLQKALDHCVQLHKQNAFSPHTPGIFWRRA